MMRILQRKTSLVNKSTLKEFFFFLNTQALGVEKRKLTREFQNLCARNVNKIDPNRFFSLSRME